MAFKNRGYNWTEVEPAGTSKMLEPGGYVAQITAVEDVESREYLRFTYDIAEGPCKGFFADDDRVYTHQFVRSYKEKAAGFMAQFLHCIEDSNDSFKLAAWDSDPDALVGKKVGIIVQREDYTNRNGEDRARMNVEGYASAADIRAGRFKMPEPKDSRDKPGDPGFSTPAEPADTAASVYDADIPF